MTGRPTASLSLDMDNLWSYMKTHGEEGWDSYPTYLPTFVPIALDWLAKWNQHITFFVVGLDAAQASNAEPLRQIANAGHEFGNHSFNHEPWMQDYDPERVRRELADTHRAIEAATGQEPVGFRGPGFAHSGTMLAVLAEMGYGFDASILPSVLGPIARLYYMWGSGMSRGERETRKGLFGRFSDGWLPLSPFAWELPGGSLVEIPVTTMPIFRVPFHLSYILWLSRFSRTAAVQYLKLGLRLCRLRGVEPSFLLHPLDFLGADDAPELSFFPGMDLPREQKLSLADRFMMEYQKRFDVVPMSEHARRVRSRGGLRHISPPAEELCRWEDSAPLASADDSRR